MHVDDKTENDILATVMNISSFSTLNSLARELSCGTAYALANIVHEITFWDIDCHIHVNILRKAIEGC